MPTDVISNPVMDNNVVEHKSTQSKYRYISDGKRDLRIDFMRGIALVMMVVAHTEVMSVFSIFTWERFGLVTGAEGFVILSGFVLGQVKRNQLNKEHILTVSYSAFRRAIMLYCINIVIIISILLLTKIHFINTFEVTHFVDRFSEAVYSMYPVGTQPTEAWLNAIIFLQIGPHQTQIIGLYFYLLLLTPLFFHFFVTQRVGWLLIFSYSFYLLYQFSAIRLTSAEFEFAFPLLAWQLIYVLGLSCGWYKDELYSLSRTKTGKFIMTVIVFVALIMMFVAFNHTNPFMPSSLFMHVMSKEQFDWFYQNFAAKNALGPMRIVNDCCLLVSTYLLLSYLWQPINRLFGWFFILLGQNSLSMFIIHVYVVLLISQFVTFDLRQQNWLLNTSIHAIALMLLWLIAKTKILSKIVPN